MVAIAVREGRAAHGGARQVAPAFIRRNSSSAVSDRKVIYFASPKGELMLAPDSRITQAQIERWPEFKGWKRCEATGSKEIEKVAVILARQEFERKKLMKIEQHIRESEWLKQLQVRCKLRRAQGYSKNDVAYNEKILKRAERSERVLYDAIAAEFDPNHRSTALQIEIKEQSTSKLASIGQKATGMV